MAKFSPPFSNPLHGQKWQKLAILLTLCYGLGLSTAYAKPVLALDKTVINSTVALSDNATVADEDEAKAGEEDTTVPTASSTANVTAVTETAVPQSAVTQPATTQNTTSQQNTVQGNDTAKDADNVTALPEALPKDADVLATSEIPLGTVAPATIQRFVKVVDTVRRHYVQPVNDEALFTHAMTGVMAGLDPYSEYLDSQAYNNLRTFTEGDMGSIGVNVQFDMATQHWLFVKVIPESPADKAGIKVGDYLHQINDSKLQNGQTQQDINQLLAGVAGTQVKMVISHQGRRKHLVMVQRSLVEKTAIEAKLINGIAVVHIPIFQNNTKQQFIQALAKMHQPFGAILLDLRNNPGGILTSAGDIASLFMQDKKLVAVRDRNGIKETVTTHGNPSLPTVPLVVLQNRYSASASEVLASSLQENGRAKILGETSYGKGSIQSVIPINDSEAVKLTVAHYYSAQGKKIDGVGVIPDIALALGELTWEEQAIALLQTQITPMRYILTADKN